jgi:SAM-dependent methyltransferase
MRQPGMDQPAVVTPHVEPMDTSDPIEDRSITAVMERAAQNLRGGRVLLIGTIDGGGTVLPEIFGREFMGAGEALEIAVPDQFQINNGLSSPFTLPYAPDSFDLVVCDRIASRSDLHAEWLAEINRVSRPGGLLLVIDYLVPGTRLRGKKARQTREAGQYINAWTRLWSPGHQRYLDRDTWQHYLLESHWQILRWTTRQVAVDFDTWCALQPLSEADRIRLRAMLLQAPEKVSGFLTPVGAGDRMSFHLTEGFILAAKPSDTL